MSVAIVQGSSGGLGLALTKHLLAHTSLKVYALTHRPSRDLKEKLTDQPGSADRLSVLGDVDVREERTLEDVAKTVLEREGKGSVRLIACLAGIVSLECSLWVI
jgi:NAD(P)-dependent dehydrogenase (short-subunit alcohol dehydrogenase family)